MTETNSLDVITLNRTSNGTTVLESMSHTTILLNGLNFLRENNCLLDITIWADGEAFKVRKETEKNAPIVQDNCSPFGFTF